MIPAIIFLIRRQSRSDIRVIALFGISILAMAALIRFKGPYYAILIAPTIPLIVAPYLENITQKLGKVTEWAFWRNLSVLSVVVAVSIINLSPAMRGSDAQFEKVLSYFRQTVPSGSLIYGTPTYWFALTDTRYVNWEQIIFQQRTMPGGTFTGAMEALKPDYLVVDGYMEQYTFDDDLCRATYRDIACVPRTELGTLLKNDATLAGEIKTDEYGDIRIYKMNWASAYAGGGRIGLLQTGYTP